MDDYTRDQLERIKHRAEHMSMLMDGAASRELRKHGGNIVSIEMRWASDMNRSTARTIDYLLSRKEG